MAADLHIHAFKPGTLTTKHFKAFFGRCLGSKWWNMFSDNGFNTPEYNEVSDTPNVWVGEVSWLKSSACEDHETFIPDAVGAVSEIIGEELPVINEELIAKIETALGLKNQTSYDVSEPNEIIAFLREHIGWQAFQISW